MKIELNSDKDLVAFVNKQLQDNIKEYGKPYCPCSLIQDEDMVCPCKAFREQDSLGECHCGKWVKIEL